MSCFQYSADANETVISRKVRMDTAVERYVSSVRTQVWTGEMLCAESAQTDLNTVGIKIGYKLWEMTNC